MSGKRVMKRFTFGVVLLALLAGPVLAQEKDEDNPMRQLENAHKKENARIDSQYQKTLDATRAATPAPVKNDPWANMRGGTDASKSK